MVHRLFPGLSKLLDFARKLLIEMEGVMRRPWEQQRWGELFIKHEEEFEVYQPYCANYADAVELMVAQEQNFIDFAKYVDKSIYPYYDELEQGIATVKRISGRTKEAQHKSELRSKLKMLEVRVEDWKGHDLSSCGELLLAEKMMVTKEGVDREFHIFLFERIIFACKEALADGKESDKGGVGGARSIRKPASGRKPVPPLVLKGRIFFTNVARASVMKGGRSLQIWWRTDDGMEHFTLHCQSEEQQKQWQTAVERQIENHSSRHSLERAARTPPSPEALRRRQGILFDVSPIQPTFRLVALATRPEARPIDEPTSPSFRFTAESQKSGPNKIVDAVLPVEHSKPSSTSSPIPLTSAIGRAQKLSTDLHNSQTTGPVTISSFMSIHEISQHLCQHGCQDVTEHLDIDSFSTFPLSSGGFGDVYRGRFKNATQVAIKTMRLQISSTELGQKSLKYAAQELHIWSKCRHPNVLPLLGLAVFRDQIGMASQWLERGSLPSYIEQNPEFDPCKMSVGIASGLTYLHSTGIVHRDLKGLNILVSDDGTPMVTDFGNAMLQDCTLNFTATTQKSSLSIRWAAPELLDERQGTYSTEADIYALGMSRTFKTVLVQLLVTPFNAALTLIIEI
ncbi:hypothetical protein FRC12_013519 [Ceratobasidium sp. 428]|nr:hypothetical protein FRC12_013519 [Ceratobasidium sp. 428]